MYQGEQWRLLSVFAFSKDLEAPKSTKQICVSRTSCHPQSYVLTFIKVLFEWHSNTFSAIPDLADFSMVTIFQKGKHVCLIAEKYIISMTIMSLVSLIAILISILNYLSCNDNFCPFVHMTYHVPVYLSCCFSCGGWSVCRFVCTDKRGFSYLGFRLISLVQSAITILITMV